MADPTLAPQSTSNTTNEKAEPAPDASANTDSKEAAKQEPSGIDTAQDEKEKDNDEPAGGFDDTPIPKRPNGYTLKFTIHSAENLPVADINAMSSDPYILAEITTDTPTRHKEDPPLRFRTATVHRQTEPRWEEEWIVANVPASGFKWKLRVYDEDPANKDDRLGNVHVNVSGIGEGWEGIRRERFDVKKRSGSKRAYGMRMVATCFRFNKQVHGVVVVSVEMVGRTEDDGQNGRLYTVGPCRWIRHYSPMLGRLAGMKEDDGDDEDNGAQQQAPNGAQQKKKIEKYNFQANQMQLPGPVPADLYHRFVEFKPFVKRMFTASGLGGAILSKALHHQHSRVYNFDRDTEWGHFEQGASKDMTKKFLDLVHYDRGGRIFTYVITLDALFRFTETGKEFSIDMLSKHTMHSNVSIYIAFSGEFFIRRLKHPRQPSPPDPVENTTYNHPPPHENNPTHPGEDISGGPPSDDPPKDPSYYELVIDNDSGTYRPNAQKLPLLKKFLAHSFPGLHIQTLDCQKDADRMQRMKKEQRDRKKREGGYVIVTQGSPRSSISSSDEEDFDRLQAEFDNPDGPQRSDRGVLSQAAKDQKAKQLAKWDKVKREALHKGKNEQQATEDADEAAPDART